MKINDFSHRSRFDFALFEACIPRFIEQGELYYDNLIFSLNVVWISPEQNKTAPFVLLIGAK